MNHKSHPFLATGILLAIAFTNSCFSGSSNVFTDTRDGQTYITDARDGKTYKVVKIGEQTWMAENLNYAAKGSMCYDDSPVNCDKYGRLYNWKEAMKACPKGWHLPKDKEWQNLADFVGDMFIAGNKLKAKSEWEDGGNGTDEYGFAALPGGLCYSHGNYCHLAGSEGHWWTATQLADDYALRRIMFYDNEHVFYFDGTKTNLFSVRCIKK
jgi:uncharacterized protein (TIGR02145 family)